MKSSRAPVAIPKVVVGTSRKRQDMRLLLVADYSGEEWVCCGGASCVQPVDFLLISLRHPKMISHQSWRLARSTVYVGLKE